MRLLGVQFQLKLASSLVARRIVFHNARRGQNTSEMFLKCSWCEAPTKRKIPPAGKCIVLKFSLCLNSISTL